MSRTEELDCFAPSFLAQTRAEGAVDRSHDLHLCAFSLPKGRPIVTFGLIITLRGKPYAHVASLT
jgi:hypothetical protein